MAGVGPTGAPLASKRLCSGSPPSTQVATLAGLVAPALPLLLCLGAKVQKRVRVQLFVVEQRTLDPRIGAPGVARNSSGACRRALELKGEIGVPVCRTTRAPFLGTHRRSPLPPRRHRKLRKQDSGAALCSSSSVWVHVEGGAVVHRHGVLTPARALTQPHHAAQKARLLAAVRPAIKTRCDR